MSPDDGLIYTDAEMKKMQESQRKRLKIMKEPPTKRQMKRKPPRVKGYERCPCGSGKLFKNCCKK
jgi:uncharacterized protein YchJ